MYSTFEAVHNASRPAYCTDFANDVGWLLLTSSLIIPYKLLQKISSVQSSLLPQTAKYQQWRGQIDHKAALNGSTMSPLQFWTNLWFWQGFGIVVLSHREPLRPAGQSQVTPVAAPSQQAPWAHTLHEWHPASMASPFMREWNGEKS